MAHAGDDDVVGPGIRSGPALAGQDGDGGPARILRAAMRRRHDLVKAARHHDAATLGEHPSDLLGGRLPLGAAAYDCDLTRHRW